MSLYFTNKRSVLHQGQNVTLQQHPFVAKGNYSSSQILQGFCLFAVLKKQFSVITGFSLKMLYFALFNKFKKADFGTLKLAFPLKSL